MTSGAQNLLGRDAAGATEDGSRDAEGESEGESKGDEGAGNVGIY